jgi:SP family general alpha glucoside:H+ symporter-like MFS transporter
MTSTTEKPEEVRVEEDVDLKADGFDTYHLVKSRYDELSIPRTLWVFRRVTLVSLAVYTGYICEGFEVSRGLLACDRLIAYA